MDVQEMSLFQLALEAVKLSEKEDQPEFDYTGYMRLLDEVAKGMRDADMQTGDYRWGDRFLRYWTSKQGSPMVVIYEYKTPSLMSLPGWTEYSSRKGVQAAEVVEG
jgi:hypothetical protein